MAHGRDAWHVIQRRQGRAPRSHVTHIAGVTEESNVRVSSVTADNVLRVLSQAR